MQFCNSAIDAQFEERLESPLDKHRLMPSPLSLQRYGMCPALDGDPN